MDHIKIGNIASNDRFFFQEETSNNISEYVWYVSLINILLKFLFIYMFINSVDKNFHTPYLRWSLLAL